MEELKNNLFSSYYYVFDFCESIATAVLYYLSRGKVWDAMHSCALSLTNICLNLIQQIFIEQLLYAKCWGY